MAMAYTSRAIATQWKNRLSKTFFGFFLSRKFSPVKRESVMPRYAIQPVPMNSDHTARIGDKKTPATPIKVQTISPARGMARPRRLAYSARCWSSERTSCCGGSDTDSPVHWECRERDYHSQLRVSCVPFESRPMRSLNRRGGLLSSVAGVSWAIRKFPLSDPESEHLHRNSRRRAFDSSAFVAQDDGSWEGTL